MNIFVSAIAAALLVGAAVVNGCGGEAAAPTATNALTEPQAEEAFLCLPSSATLSGTYKCRGEGTNTENKPVDLSDDVYGLYHYRRFVCFSAELNPDGFAVPTGSVTASLYVNDAGKVIVLGREVER